MEPEERLMPRFGTFYAAGQLIVFEITIELDSAGRPTYVATLSVDPRVRVEARRPETAALTLQAIVQRQPAMAHPHAA